MVTVVTGEAQGSVETRRGWHLANLGVGAGSPRRDVEVGKRF